MHGAIWTLAYDIDSAERERYLQWFHDVHIPEKLARPGYIWAAHYEGPPSEEGADGVVRHGFIALFGSDSTRVFLDPSPAQIKPTQDPQTREMMRLRHHPLAMILAHEWSAGDISDRADDVIHSAGLGLLCASAQGRDEQLGAWCAQELIPGLCAQPECARAHKFSNVMSGVRHAVMQEINATAPSTHTPIPMGELGLELAPHTQITTRFGTRIWPAQ